jgi:hypothetical protein
MHRQHTGTQEPACTQNQAPTKGTDVSAYDQIHTHTHTHKRTPDNSNTNRLATWMSPGQLPSAVYPGLQPAPPLPHPAPDWLHKFSPFAPYPAQPGSDTRTTFHLASTHSWQTCQDQSASASSMGKKGSFQQFCIAHPTPGPSFGGSCF